MMPVAIAFLKSLAWNIISTAIAVAVVKFSFGENWLMSAALVFLVIGAFRPVEEAVRAAWREFRDGPLSQKEQGNG